MKLPLEDKLQALLLLSSLLDSWETLLISLSTSAHSEKLIMEMVKESLLSEEARRKKKDESSSEALIFEKHERHGRSESRFPQGHDNRDKSKSRSRSRKCIKCFHYNRVGHMKECKFLMKEQSLGSKEERERPI